MSTGVLRQSDSLFDLRGAPDSGFIDTEGHASKFIQILDESMCVVREDLSDWLQRYLFSTADAPPIEPPYLLFRLRSGLWLSRLAYKLNQSVLCRDPTGGNERRIPVANEHSYEFLRGAVSNYNLKTLSRSSLPPFPRELVLCAQLALGPQDLCTYGYSSNPSDSSSDSSTHLTVEPQVAGVQTKKLSIADRWLARDNISVFLKWCKDLGIPQTVLFETTGLVHRTEEKNVLLTLMELARIASRFGLEDLPELVRMEREIDLLEERRLRMESVDPSSECNPNSRTDSVASAKTMGNFTVQRPSNNQSIDLPRGSGDTDADTTFVSKFNWEPNHNGMRNIDSAQSDSGHTNHDVQIVFPPSGAISNGTQMRSNGETQTNSLGPSDQTTIEIPVKGRPPFAMNSGIQTSRHGNQSDKLSRGTEANGTSTAIVRVHQTAEFGGQTNSNSFFGSNQTDSLNSAMEGVSATGDDVRTPTQYPYSAPVSDRTDSSVATGSGDANSSGFGSQTESSDDVQTPTRRPSDPFVARQVVQKIALCTCCNRFHMQKLEEGRYRLGNRVYYLRRFRNHVMVRVGGGWLTLDEFLARHDPCRKKAVKTRRATEIIPPSEKLDSNEDVRQRACSTVTNKPLPCSGSLVNLHRRTSTSSNDSHESAESAKSCFSGNHKTSHLTTSQRRLVRTPEPPARRNVSKGPYLPIPQRSREPSPRGKTTPPRSRTNSAPRIQKHARRP
ncbi:unnamed protein product [Calicophoron daubneyi]|uniref:GAR domain-containing protein n=1 Tax=Calicophoron daubneyi TaxID=300641 RepID=A0AAV2TP10_CALDB